MKEIKWCSKIMSELKAEIKQIVGMFSVIKMLAEPISYKVLTEIIDQCNKESIILPMVDPTAYMKVSNNFYKEIKDVIKLIKQIKDFKFHLHVKVD